MANLIQSNSFVAGSTIYCVITNQAGQFWNATTSAFETFNSSNWTSTKYCFGWSQVGSTSIYTLTFPSLAAGVYDVMIFLQAGGSPAATDSGAGSASVQWDGTNIIAPVVITPGVGLNFGGAWITDFGGQEQGEGIEFAGDSEIYEDSGGSLHLNGYQDGTTGQVFIDDGENGTNFGGIVIAAETFYANGGISTNGVGGGGLIATNLATTGNSGTSETALWSTAIPSHSMLSGPIELTATIALASSARTKEVRVRLGGSGLSGTVIADTGAATPTGAASVTIAVRIFALSGSSAIATFQLLNQTNVSFSPSDPVTTVTGLSGSLFLVVTGQVGTGGTTNDMNMGPAYLLAFA